MGPSIHLPTVAKALQLEHDNGISCPVEDVHLAYGLSLEGPNEVRFVTIKCSVSGDGCALE